MANRVTKEIIIADLLQIDPSIAAILMASGMHCVFCPSAAGESLEEAAMVGGLNINFLVNGINAYLAAKEGKEEAMEAAMDEE